MHHVTPNTNEAVTDKSLFSPEKTGVLKCLLARTMLPRLGPFGYALLCLLLVMPGSLWAGNGEEVESTMLMFVGENIEVLSIASRREESAWQAPAVADVISREDFREKGLHTLSDALSLVPGFFMARKEWGHEPYLWGIPNSVLLLYDTVPLNADTSKSLHQIDAQLSLGPVKQVEVVRGPGSVLWGPDAFAGVVNIVPLTGRDVSGVETRVSYTAPQNQVEVTANMGGQMGAVDGLLSVNAGRNANDDAESIGLVRFWRGDDQIFPPADRFGDETIAASRHLDIFGRVSLGNAVAISGRLVDNRVPYAIRNAGEELTWQEARKNPGGFAKIEARKSLARHSAVRFMSYFSQYDPEFEIVDRTISQREKSAYGEAIYDHGFFSGRGLLTGGISYREKWVEDANIWVSYLPEFLGSGNESFAPVLLQEDYNTRLWSFFGQCAYKINNFDFSVGLRFDAHDSYSDNLSFNASLVWHPVRDWIGKVLYGTAYRTPFARQMLGDETPNLEKAQNLSAQLTWKPSRAGEFSMTGFFIEIDNHISEDPYAGLSSPNSQKILGMELSGLWRLGDSVEISSNLSLMNNWGPDETYRYVRSIFVRPDGSVEVEYDELNYAYDAGPKRIFNLMGTWRPTDRIFLFGRLYYFSERTLAFPRGGEFATDFAGQWLIDVSGGIEPFFLPGTELLLSIKNLADRDYQMPGTYAGADGYGICARIELRKKW